MYGVALEDRGMARVQQAGLRVIALADNPGVADAATALALPLLSVDRKRTRTLAAEIAAEPPADVVAAKLG